MRLVETLQISGDRVIYSIIIFETVFHCIYNYDVYNIKYNFSSCMFYKYVLYITWVKSPTCENNYVNITVCLNVICALP